MKKIPQRRSSTAASPSRSSPVKFKPGNSPIKFQNASPNKTTGLPTLKMKSDISNCSASSNPQNESNNSNNHSHSLKNQIHQTSIKNPKFLNSNNLQKSFSFNIFKKKFESVFENASQFLNLTGSVEAIREEFPQQTLTELTRYFHTYVQALRKGNLGQAKFHGTKFAKCWTSFDHSFDSVAIIGHSAIKTSIANSLDALEAAIKDVETSLAEIKANNKKDQEINNFGNNNFNSNSWNNNLNNDRIEIHDRAAKSCAIHLHSIQKLRKKSIDFLLRKTPNNSQFASTSNLPEIKQFLHSNENNTEIIDDTNQGIAKNETNQETKHETNQNASVIVDSSTSNDHSKLINSGDSCRRKPKVIDFEITDDPNYSTINEKNKIISSQLLEQITDDARVITRRLSESFLKEFAQVGLRGSMRLRTESSAASSDVIRGLKAAALFDESVLKLDQSISEFESLLKESYSLAGLPSDIGEQKENKTIKFTLADEDEADDEDEDELSDPIDSDKKNQNELQSLEKENKDETDFENDDEFNVTDGIIGFVEKTRKKLFERVVNKRFGNWFCNTLIKLAVAEKKELEMSQRNNFELQKLLEKNNSNIIDLQKEMENLKHELSNKNIEITKINQELSEYVSRMTEKDAEIRDMKMKESEEIEKKVNNYKAIEVQTEKSKESSALENLTNLRESIRQLSGIEITNNNEENEEKNDTALLTVIRSKINSLEEQKIELTRRAVDAESKLAERDDESTEIARIISTVLIETGMVKDDNESENNVENQNKENEEPKIKSFLIEQLKFVQKAVVKARARLAAAVERSDYDGGTSLLNLVARVEEAAVHLAVTGVKGDEFTELAIKAANNVINQRRSLIRINEAMNDVLSTYKTENNNCHINNPIEPVEIEKKNLEDEAEAAVMAVRESIVTLAKTSENPLQIITVKLATADARRGLVSRAKNVISVLLESDNKQLNNGNDENNIDQEVSHLLDLLESSKKSTNIATMKRIENRLCKMLNVQNVNEDDLTNHVFDLLSSLEKQFEKYSVFVKDIKSKLHVLGEGKEEIDSVSEKVLSTPSQTMPFIEQVRIFSDVFDYIPVSSRNDANLFLPEIASAVHGLHESITCLKPFSTTLGSIQDSYNMKNMNPTNAENLMNDINSLKTLFNNLEKKNINALVISTLARFLTLISSLVTMIFKK
ncbi:hypothetical protein TRFO_38040 [Tritrichomonas foetus]|uniref:G protein gamma domain-containing protein n=1 Tax=Tritrichomonas foetus TaxID=1144522 RepID=A0A1J4JAX1_9EUKA|nr:hypothetical protein TRFO_38040 [Tritrichomonas foetus]|eukprot:OHS95817.1 hypothetical protein TRFO_38040 [Tritrichomonas foetus]